MARRGGWTRQGSPRRFRYYDSRGNRIVDAKKLERIEGLRIPPAWRDVWISPRAHAKLQATGVDAAGRRQYLYHPEYRARQEQVKYDKLVRFAERLPELRATMSEHIELEPLERRWTCAVALRIIDLTWFRVGSERYARESRTYGVTTLRKRHVDVRGNRIRFSYRGKGKLQVRRAVVDDELAAALGTLLAFAGGTRLFRYRIGDDVFNLTSRTLNEYVHEHLGEDFSAKDFRTWGGTLAAAIAFAERGLPQSETQARRAVAAVMRSVGEQLGNTPAVARTSYVSPAVVDQYLDGRTIDDFRPRRLRIVGARDTGLNQEEQALLSLLRSYRIRRAREAA
ncbi:MAG: DNA topoisomerase IB [Thermoleophilia bacterium]|nr:DNA topoisomerase IB [Thermoleophilia bacterium]